MALMTGSSPSTSATGEALLQRYSPGTRVWLPCKEKVWKPGMVKKYDGGNLECEVNNGSSADAVMISVKSPVTDLPPLRNPDILIGQNDLTSLSYLHEPAVLYNLDHRFTENNFIYTYCGIVLVAINPYEELPIYGKETIWAYRGHNWGELDPHIFAVAEDAFTKMERENKDQSIIVSGESGAGKTVSAKYAMRYFATVGGSENETQIERKVLASSPIMEAIGNAKTTRNDNSSRFGKYVEVNFDTKYSIIGASMRTYLLEKSRVVFQSEDERNYHIFYQLCAARNTHAEAGELYLGASESFHYTNQGSASSLTLPGVSDEQLFSETVEALTLLGFGIDDRRNFFKLLAAILHLGNVQIIRGDQKGSGGDQSCSIAKDDLHLANFCTLLQVDFDLLRKWLTFRRIVTGREEFLKPMSPADAINCRDAFSKLLYAEVFNWIVAGINRSLLSSGQTQRFIGVLDIYGFETFEINSFEQFCINYANEKLQQQFNQHVFKLEQEEYVREKIQWTFIEFYDNQPCIDLIESKLGILDLLDEECRMPKGSDTSWVQKLYQKCGGGAHFEKPRMSQSAFIVVHFADRVQYESQGFLEKNRDTVLQDQIATVAASKNTWIASLLEPKDINPTATSITRRGATGGRPATGGTISTAMRKKTVGSQFRESLTLLMQSLNATTPHYVRCIKPNDSKTPFEFDPHRAVQQLRACGVLETIRISAAGFPSRWTYGDFFSRYRPLVRSAKDVNRSDPQQTCEKIVNGMISDEDQFRFGKSKIFFRAGQVAYLEKVRMEKMRSSAVVIQKIVRGFIYAKRYRRIQKASCLLQCYGRGMLARKLALKLRQAQAAIRIQTCYRRWREQRKFEGLKKMSVRLQARVRGYLARLKCVHLREERASIILQKWARGMLQRARYNQARGNVIKIQSCVRRWLAKRRLKELRTEARSIEHVKQLNKGLENKIISLQQRIEELTKNQGQSKKVAKEYDKLKVQLENYKHMEKDLKAALEKIGELESINGRLDEELRNRMDQEVDFVTTKVELEGQVERLKAELKGTEERLSEMGGELEEKQRKEDNNSKLKREMEQLERERETEQQAYQQLLKKMHDMEQQLLSSSSGENFAKGSSYTSSRPTPVPRRSLAPTSLDSGFPSLDRSPSPTRRALQQQQLSASADIGLVLVLQQKLKQSETEREHIQKLLEEQSASNPDSETRRTQDLIRLQELEMENAKLRDDLNKLRSTENPASEIQRQFQSLQEELSRKREESIQLRTVLASPKGRKLRGSPAGDNNGSNHSALEDESSNSALNGDDEDEIGLILQTQKKIIQQLERELQAEKLEKQSYSSQIRSLEDEVNKQSVALGQALTGGGGGDLHLRNEVGRLTHENITLRDQVTRLKQEVKRAVERAVITHSPHDSSIISSGGGPIDSLTCMPSYGGSGVSSRGHPQLGDPTVFIRKKDQVYLGMFEYRQEDEGKVMRALILDLQPAIALSAQPSGLPAFILFMMIRYTDYINDDNKVRSLLTSAITFIKRLMRKRGDALDVTVLWLSNILRFLHTLKQYSGDGAFQAENTPKQNEQCLKNFDLSEYRQVLSDHAVWIYMMLIKILEQDMQTMIVPAILENTSIDAGGGTTSMRGSGSATEKQKPLDTLIRKLDITYNLLCSYGLDVEVINQVFRQLFYYVCAGALNNLLLRRELCNWSKGLEIRYNVSALEEWGRSKRMEEVVKQTLSPVIQASQILQARKSDNDVATICDIADSLTVQQVVKLLNLYSSKDGIDADKVSKQFIERVQSRLLAKRENEGHEVSQKSKLLMDTQHTYAVKFPFNPSNVQLELVAIPDSFGLSQWLKKM